MNMLYADVDGHIGQVQAVRLPSRPIDGVSADVVQPPEILDPVWERLVDATSLPALEDPEIGYVASSNNRPPEGDVRIGLVFSTDDRIDRLGALMKRRKEFRIDDLGRMQRDVYMAASVDLRDRFVAAIEDLELSGRMSAEQAELLRWVRNWDGYYHSYSRGALAYELLRREFCLRYYAPVDRDGHSAFTDIVGIERMIEGDLDTDRSARMRDALLGGLRAAVGPWNEFEDWGDAHRLTFVHPFAIIPFIGDRYRFGAFKVGGAVQTLAKAGHNPLGEDFHPSHGATARFLSDLSDPDGNLGVIVSGQDGWIGSENFLDQAEGFLRGQYLPMPLSLDEVRRRSAHVHEFVPGSAGER